MIIPFSCPERYVLDMRLHPFSIPHVIAIEALCIGFLLYQNINAIAFQYPVTCIIPSIDSGSNFYLPLFVL